MEPSYISRQEYNNSIYQRDGPAPRVPQSIYTDKALTSDVGLTIAEFMLTPNIPESEQDKFKQFSVMYCNIMALGNIKSYERFAMICAFEEICILLEWGDYERANQLMAEELMMMQSSRSIDAVNLLYGQHGVDRREIVDNEIAKKKHLGLTQRITSAIRGGK